MSTLPPVTKTVNYRLCDASAAPNKTPTGTFDLQGLLTSISAPSKGAKSKNAPWRRQIGIAGHDYQHLLYLVHKQASICGALVRSSRRLVSLVDADNNTGATIEETIHPKDKNGVERPVEDHAMFFAVCGNHVAVIQSKELSISEFEHFLTWLIQTEHQLATDWQFSLVNLPAKSAKAKLKAGASIKGIKIGKSLFQKTRTPVAGSDGKKRKRYTTTLKSDPTMMGVLRALMPNGAILDQIEKGSDPGSLFVDLKITYRSKSEHEGRKVLGEIAATFGEHQDLHPRIELSDNTIIKGDELTIHGKVSVQNPNNTISKDDAMTALANWLKDAIRDKKV
jgi:hypothetical protein